MNQLKILWLNWRCWLNPAMGGAEVFTKEVAQRWASKGHRITLFTSEFSGCKKEEISNGVKIVRSGGRFSVYWQAKKMYEKRFQFENFDLVIDEINTIPFFTPGFVNKGEKVIALIHQLARQYWFYETPFPLSYLGYYYFEDKWLRKYRNLPVVTVSESTSSDLKTLGFTNTFVVPEGLNFIPFDTLPQRSVKPVVVYAGRLKRTKRPDHALKAFKIIKDRIPEAELWVIGDGPLKGELEKKAVLGVKFFSGLDNSMRRNLINQSWVLLNPGLREGWGLNIIEANAMGVPAVAYNVHGLRDSVKDNETGLLAKEGDPNDLAEKAITILENEILSQKLRLQALEYSRSFSWEKTASSFMAFLENANFL